MMVLLSVHTISSNSLAIFVECDVIARNRQTALFIIYSPQNGGWVAVGFVWRRALEQTFEMFWYDK